MASPSEILGGMVDVADEQVENLDSSIGQVDEQIDAYLEEIDGVENGMCGVAETNMTDYLANTKLAEIQALWPEVPGVWGPVYIVYGGTYGSIDYTTGNITDWEFRQDDLSVLPPPPPPGYLVRYSYTPGNDTEIDGLVSDYAFGNDYLTRPLTSGAVYGLYPNLNSMTDAKNILVANKNKIAASKTAFQDYI